MVHALPLDPAATSSQIASSQIAPIELESIPELIADEARPAPSDRPWVALNMVTSADGATAVNGVSGSLGSDVDSSVFHALRGVADAVLAGSGTVTAERYRVPAPPPAIVDARLERGQLAAPRLVVISNRGDIDLGLPMFIPPADQASRPIVFVAAGQVPADRLRQLDDVAEVIPSGDEHVALGDALVRLRSGGAQVVVCEGGPTLNGLLAADDLIDEWCLTVAPHLAGGRSDRAATGPDLDAVRRLELVRAWHHDSELLLRYTRVQSPT